MSSKNLSNKRKNQENEEKIIPPDGGWGWVIVFAYALNNIVMIPLLFGLGLIFKDLFPQLGFTKKEEALILSTNMGFGMAMGLTHGPLIKKFGYRKIGITGSLLFSSGLLITAFSTSFIQFMVTYGLMTSFGISLTMSSVMVAINSYFSDNRGKAMGIGSFFTGFGPIIMPQIIGFLMNIYSNQGTIIILSAITLHCFLASLLLQPVEWHALSPDNKPKDNEESERQNLTDNDKKLNTIISNTYEIKRTVSVTSLSRDNENNGVIDVTEETKKRQFIFLRGDNVTSLSQSVNDLHRDKVKGKNYGKNQHNSEKGLNINSSGSCGVIFDDSMIYGAISFQNLTEKNENDLEKFSKSKDNNLEINSTSNCPEIISKEKIDKPKGCCSRFLRKTVDIFDLSLLCDLVYVNIAIGTSIATAAETSFSMFTPFILKDLNLDTSQIAIVMTTMAVIDLPMRGFGPSIAKLLKQPSRVMYLISLGILIISRTTLIFCTDLSSVIFTAIGLGFARGLRTVFMSLILPNYIPIERLAHANGIQMVANAISLFSFGPLIGVIRENFGSYNPCIVFVNIMSMITITMWTVELLYIRWKNQREYRAVNTTI